VSEGAQLLTFGASAELMLSNGETCFVDAPASLIRAKGYKHAVPSNLRGTFPISARLDAGNTPGGYVEK
jgi:hypothetical protein